MQYSKEFFTLFVLALVVLGLSIWAFVAPCKKDGFKDLYNDCCIDPDPKNCASDCQTCNENETCTPSSMSACGGWCISKKDEFGDQGCTPGCGSTSESEPPSPYDCGARNGETECSNKPGYRQACIRDFSTGEDNCCGNNPSGGALKCYGDAVYCGHACR